MNKCANNPCANGGQCNALGVASFNCSCTNGWGGATCEEAITAITAEDSATTATVVGIVSGVVAGIIVIVIVIVVVICVTRNPGGDKNDVVTPGSPRTPRTPRGTRIVEMKKFTALTEGPTDAEQPESEEDEDDKQVADHSKSTENTTLV